MTFSYDYRFVAFVDVLGFSALISDEQRSERFARAMHKILGTMLDPNVGFAELTHIFNGEQFEVECSWPASDRAMVSSISDALVISLPENTEPDGEYPSSRVNQILVLLEHVKRVQTILCAAGVLCRGGVTHGRIHHEHNFAIGEALIAAYNLESKVALYPRVLIGEEVIEILMSEEIPDGYFAVRNRIAHAITIDRDGLPYVNYFGWNPLYNDGLMYPEEEHTRAIEFFEKQLNDESRERVREKLTWAVDHLKHVKKMYTSESDLAYTLTNAKTDFGLKYLRTWENLREAVSNLERNGEYKDVQNLLGLT